MTRLMQFCKRRSDYEVNVSVNASQLKGVGDLQIDELVAEAHRNAKNKGFWDSPREFGTMLALIHSELSEALEAHRIEDWNGVREEIADVFIRLGDLCGGVPELADIKTAIGAKMRKNKNRPRLHGKGY